VNAIIPSTLVPIPVVPPHPGEPDSRWLSGWYYRDFLELGAVQTAPRTARGVIRERLPWWGLGHLQYTAELVATEMITNSVAATRELAWEGAVPPVRIWLLGGDIAAAVLVWDGVPTAPARREAGRDDESGRGLGIVAALSQESDWYFPPAPFWGKVSRAFIS
jgi:hypothetical protein